MSTCFCEWIYKKDKDNTSYSYAVRRTLVLAGVSSKCTEDNENKTVRFFIISLRSNPPSFNARPRDHFQQDTLRLGTQG